MIKHGLLFLLALTLTGCTRESENATLTTNAAPGGANTVTAAATPTPSPAVHKVTYRITGIPSGGQTAASAQWMVQLASQSQKSRKVALPYTEDLIKHTGEDCSIMVQNTSRAMGDIRIEVLVDGKLVDRVQGTGFPILSSIYRIPLSGATAACNDGTFSYEQQRANACSDHQGAFQFYLADGTVVRPVNSDEQRQSTPIPGQTR